MAESGTPLVVGAASVAAADELRNAIAQLASVNGGLADTRLAGRTVAGAASLEDVIRLTVSPAAPIGADIPDAARELGIVVVMRELGGDARERVASAHYMRPIERDGAGHIQRRPPALLAAWNERAARLDHFDWGFIDELAARARIGTAEFARRQRQLVQSLVGHGGSPPDAPH